VDGAAAAVEGGVAGVRAEGGVGDAEGVPTRAVGEVDAATVTAAGRVVGVETAVDTVSDPWAKEMPPPFPPPVALLPVIVQLLTVRTSGVAVSDPPRIPPPPKAV
jgi:hypothetical protein